MSEVSKEDVKKLVLEVHKNEGKVPQHLVDHMFSMHNLLFPNNKEYNKGCSSCRRRTFGRIQKYYNELI